MQYKIVRNGGAWHVVPVSSTMNGLEYRPYGTYQECIARAERHATIGARKGSSARKGQRIVRRRGDTFYVEKVG